jgi:hypothetical protein
MYSEVCIAIPIMSVEVCSCLQQARIAVLESCCGTLSGASILWAISGIERAVLAKTAQILGICKKLTLKNSKSRVKRAIPQ